MRASLRSVSGLQRLFGAALALCFWAAGSPGAARAQDQNVSSRSVTWSCTGEPCPWGDTTEGQALVWPEALAATQTRMGYTTSEPIYLPAERAKGLTLTLTQGSANLYVGTVNDAWHRVIAVLKRGEPHTLSELAKDEVLSIQGSAQFAVTLPAPTEDHYYPEGKVLPSIHATWRCARPGCTDGDWYGEVINWPSWAAYHTNARSGGNSRAVFDDEGTPLYPYMGKWAEGCRVTAHSGVVLIIEWERGTDVWRETRVYPGQTHTITLRPSEDGAMIETVDNEPAFSASLENCDPKPLP